MFIALKIACTLYQDIVVRYVCHTLAFHHWSVLSISAFQVEAHNLSHDAIEPDTQAYPDDDLIDIRDENGTNLLLPNAKAETISSPPPSHPTNKKILSFPL